MLHLASSPSPLHNKSCLINPKWGSHYTHAWLPFLISSICAHFKPYALGLDFCNVGGISLKRKCVFVIEAMPLTMKDRRATTSILKLKIDTTFASHFWPFKNVAVALLTIEFMLIQYFHIMSFSWIWQWCFT